MMWMQWKHHEMRWAGLGGWFGQKSWERVVKEEVFVLLQKSVCLEVSLAIMRLMVL